MTTLRQTQDKFQTSMAKSHQY